jgi:hypothetical protein
MEINTRNLPGAKFSQYVRKKTSLPSVYKLQKKLNRNHKAILLIGHGAPEGCEMLRLPHLLDNQLADGSEVVSLIPQATL